SVYDGVSRTNATINILPLVKDATDADKLSILAQARTMRGHYHFEAKRMWNTVPYLDETVKDFNVSNDQDIWPQIEADLKFGYDNLGEKFPEIGRINKWVAAAMYAKALMYQKKFAAALPVLNDIIANGKNSTGTKFGLMDKFGDVFDIANNNNKESVFQIQYSVNDGSQGWNGGWGEVLNFPYKSGGSPGGCCGFFQPTSEFVNSFRTSGGKPLLDGSYNAPANAVKNDDGLNVTDAFVPDAGPLDPRLDWTVGRRGIPYFDWGPHTGRDWIRDQNYAGPYSPKKQVYRKSQEGTNTEVGNWTSGWTANGYRMIRFAEILLLAAECQAETGNGDLGLANVNKLRQRAANADGFVQNVTGTGPAASYSISLYSASDFSSKDQALLRIRFERKLELGMEGHRFFDLVRWGIAKPTIDAFLAYEGAIRKQMYQGASFQAGVDEYYPIPQLQIDASRGKLKQNPGR
ncbi:MAG: RagB/SusD family nutrient uptake outer membrane protein, partial [Cyclobacteriaceae bacterium]|nr:RagB/SusD family nutrient uptake outer membrane protein [Cyclobacteriaceae bacterium]